MLWIYVISNPYLACFGCNEVQGLYHLWGNFIWWLRLWNQLRVLLAGVSLFWHLVCIENWNNWMCLMNGHDWVSTAGTGRPSRHIQWVPVVRSSRHDVKLHTQQNLIVLRSTNSKDWMKLMFSFHCKRFSYSVIHTHRRMCGYYYCLVFRRWWV